jgi:hypothetical protein
MENPILNPELKPLSASRVKTLENCAWLYWCNYHLKLPQEQNEGAKMGDICHCIFELILSKNRKAMFDKMVRADTVTVCPAIERLIQLYIKRHQLHDTTAGFLQIDQMILVGFKSDFYVQDGQLVAPEFRFDIVSDRPRFRIKGFMDKVYKRGQEMVIDDFKSSKRKFAGEDQESNLQALFYSFASSQLFPEFTPMVRFIFLQYPKDPIMTLRFTPDALLGFKYYLAATQLKVEGFNEHTAKSNFAADSPSVPDEFKGKSLCGFASHPGKLKKDGTKMWHCPYRFGFDYYAIKKDKKVVTCAFTEQELRPRLPGETVEKGHYLGCPRHINTLDSFQMPQTQPVSESKPHVNVLDDLF